jgi:hypothetical protein
LPKFGLPDWNGIEAFYTEPSQKPLTGEDAENERRGC